MCFKILKGRSRDTTTSSSKTSALFQTFSQWRAVTWAPLPANWTPGYKTFFGFTFLRVTNPPSGILWKQQNWSWFPGCYQDYVTYFDSVEPWEKLVASKLCLHWWDWLAALRPPYQDSYGACLDQHLERSLAWMLADIWLLQHWTWKERTSYIRQWKYR